MKTNDMKHIVIPIHPKTHKPNISQIAIYPDKDKAQNVSLFLKKAGMLGIVLEVKELSSLSEFCKLWEEDQKQTMLNQIKDNKSPKSNKAKAKKYR